MKKLRKAVVGRAVIGPTCCQLLAQSAAELEEHPAAQRGELTVQFRQRVQKSAAEGSEDDPWLGLGGIGIRGKAADCQGQSGEVGIASLREFGGEDGTGHSGGGLGKRALCGVVLHRHDVKLHGSSSG